MSFEKYLTMQKDYYDVEAEKWSLSNKNPVVGWYDQHTNFSDYDDYLFKDFDTTEKLALEYGCGPGRNLIRFDSRFRQVDGVDISSVNIEKAKLNLEDALSPKPVTSKLFSNNGNDIPVEDNTYDVVFSVICLQHICVHEIRYKIMQEIYRVLKPAGYFCAQMGFGNKPGNNSKYYDNTYEATSTNGGHDVTIDDEDFLKDDLKKIGFNNYKSDIRNVGPGDNHANWIWFQGQK
jgi:SAM-dependent methyltransferase